ncbi:TIR domain-containing protein [Roseomonas sp. HF4]|uniref:TIR domain-containing protein n=1 Tax=Roseomonas sp. HF4 TaxID=2562313 RepID=UPI0010BFC350|nr:TIR domain-containing protein [Roseomonas sp. HF4]
MADVFVSYKSNRKSAVEHLARVLELNGYSVWFDHALVAGEAFAPPIERELRSAPATIVTWCSLSIESDWVREEASLAKRLKTIIPVRIERVDVPLGFATLHTIDLSRWDGAPRSHVVDRLLLEVARLVGREPVPRVRDLLDYDRMWRRSGAPTLLQLAGIAAQPSKPRRPSTNVQQPAEPAAHEAAEDRPTAGTAQAGGGTSRSAALQADDGTVLARDDSTARGRGSGAPTAQPRQSERFTPAPPDRQGHGAGKGQARAVTALRRHPVPTKRSPDPAALEDKAFQASRPAATAARPGGSFPRLPAKPSLVVLPFANIGGDVEEEYFADGLTEELTAELARLRWFFVIARNSAFTYKGKGIDVRLVGRELGVRYALEGSVRKAGRQLRISGRLIEAETGHAIWADRFDGDMERIFDLQDRVTQAVAGALDPTLRNAEIDRARAKPPKSLDAYDLYLRALPHYHFMSEGGTTEAQSLLRRAFKASPDFALAKSLFAACQVRRQGEGWAKPGETQEALRLAREAAATALGDPTVLSQCAVAVSYLDYAHGEAQSLIDKALSICPNSALVEGAAGLVHVYACRPEPAIRHLQHAMRLSPLDPWTSTFLMGIATAHQMAGRLEEALATAQASVHASPTFGAPRRLIVATLVMLGRIADAQAAAEELRIVSPSAYHVFADRVYARNPDKAFATRLIDAYRAAGMPE